MAKIYQKSFMIQRKENGNPIAEIVEVTGPRNYLRETLRSIKEWLQFRGATKVRYHAYTEVLAEIIIQYAPGKEFTQKFDGEIKDLVKKVSGIQAQKVEVSVRIRGKLPYEVKGSPAEAAKVIQKLYKETLAQRH